MVVATPKSNPNPMPTPAPSADIMPRLRAGTARIHAATEDLPLMRALLSPAVNKADYLRYLRALYGVYLGVEPVLYSALSPTLLSRLGVRPKLPALQRDLAALGAPTPLPPAGWNAALRGGITGPAAALGGLYVLEGATLGGRVIARRLRRNLGDQASALPFNFLEFEQQEPGRAWRDFGVGLEQAAADCGEPPTAVIAGAVAVFTGMHRGLGLTGGDATAEHDRDQGPGQRMGGLSHE